MTLVYPNSSQRSTNTIALILQGIYESIIGYAFGKVYQIDILIVEVNFELAFLVLDNFFLEVDIYEIS